MSSRPYIIFSLPLVISHQAAPLTSRQRARVRRRQRPATASARSFLGARCGNGCGLVVVGVMCWPCHDYSVATSCCGASVSSPRGRAVTGLLCPIRRLPGRCPCACPTVCKCCVVTEVSSSMLQRGMGRKKARRVFSPHFAFSRHC